MKTKKVSTHDILAAKSAGPKLTAVTAYDFTMASLLDEGGVDILLVGDSLGMVVQGADNTLSVTLEEMIYHCRAVARAKPRAHIACDLPFMSYQLSAEVALVSSGRLVKEGYAESVKLEGGREIAASVARIVAAGIPVMGHIGLTPQAVHRFGGFRIQGKTEEAAKGLLQDAVALAEAGVYALVIEGVPQGVAALITEQISVPTIGIGAGAQTDGQVLVCYDLLGMYRGLSPKFVKRFAELGDSASAAIATYVDDVRSGAFPAAEHAFSMATGQDLESLKRSLDAESDS